jgi:hypothetical protein
LSQAAILENQIILNAKEVTFPAKPIITNEAKVTFRSLIILKMASSLNQRAQI